MGLDRAPAGGVDRERPAILRKILHRRRLRLEQARTAGPLEELKRRLLDRPAPRSLRAALTARGRRPHVIAELKRRSPSRGPLMGAGVFQVVQRAYESVGDVRGYQIVEGQESAAETVARRAVDLLSAEPPEAGPHTVLLDPKLCGVFVHEAFGHLSEGDFIHENDRLREVMKLGRRFGPDGLTICDHPDLPGEAGYYAYDAEGTPGGKTELIRGGILTRRLHSRETAAMMDEPPTGNARCLNYSYAPIVRMSNTYLEPREHTFDQLLDGVADGIYAIGAIGGQTDMEMFTFSAEEGYEIKNGRLGRRLRDVVLTGNVFQTLENIDLIGNDLHMHGGLGGCGKGGQSPLRVSDGGPSVRIQNVVVGGR